ncbi:hypothetical protein KY284_010135 [Solanum tuberosum]|nr:hypothetical protein KY284_010135 [Solanum tuberosum]
MAKCDFCSVYDPDSECLQAESCLFVKYGIALKVKNDAVFREKFEKLVRILPIQSILEMMQAVAVSVVPVPVDAAAAPSGSRTSNGFKKILKYTATFFKALADASVTMVDVANQANFFPPPDMPPPSYI